MSPSPANAHAALPRAMRWGDLAGFYVISALSLRWIATAAALGPGAITLWILAWADFFVPLAASVIVLSQRFPAEGGLYIWSREAFGDFAGFVAGWTYWMSNLPYFPSILYFAAACLLYTRSSASAQTPASSSPLYYIAFSVGALLLITALNVIGLRWSKWLNNLGAIGVWLPLFALFGLAGYSAVLHGPATHITARSLIPEGDFKNAIFWSTIAFAFGGCECASFMGDEIENPRKNIPRALFFGGTLVTVGYLGGTLAMLWVLPPERISGLGGLMTAIKEVCERLGFGMLVAPIAVLVTLSSLGSASAFLTSTSRLPFVAGLDAYLPKAFGRVHPRFGTPYVAVIIYGTAGILFALLGQAGATVKSAYDILVSMSILTFFIPYAFLFAAVLRLERQGRWWLRVLATLGLLTTLLTLVFSAVPAEDDPQKALTLWKTLGSTAAVVFLGMVIYGTSNARLKRS